MNRRLYDFFLLLRPYHWLKNLLVVAPAFFAGELLSSYEVVFEIFWAFISFSFISSAGYILNDIYDVDRDKLHPLRKRRPLVSGSVDIKEAILLFVLCIVLSLVFASMLPLGFIITLLLYFVLTGAYTVKLKDIVIIDSFCIAGGFVLRLIGGGQAIGVEVSGWLFLTTFLLSLLLAFGKRRAEFNYLGESEKFRKVLKHYDKGFLDIALGMFSTMALLTFSLYAVDRGPELFIITVPIACYGTLRYVYLVQTSFIGDPTEILIKDRWMIFSVLLWIVITGIITHFYDTLSFLPKHIIK